MPSLHGTGAAILSAALLIPAAPCSGHDCWMTPTDFFPSPGDTLVVEQRFGHLLETEIATPLDEEITTRFVLVAPDTTIDLLAEPRGPIHPTLSPLLKRRLTFPGTTLLALDHGFLTIALPSEGFTKHLELEGLHEIKALREGRASRETDRERYARSMKMLLCVGEEPRGLAHQTALGQDLEILLMDDPCSLAPGDSLDVQVLFRKEPMKDKMVWALNRGPGREHTSVQKTRTDSRGRASFVLQGTGTWLLRLVHMLPCEACSDADWESYWASFSFSVR